MNSKQFLKILDKIETNMSEDDKILIDLLKEDLKQDQNLTTVLSIVVLMSLAFAIGLIF